MTFKYPRIATTGLPCSGKTTLAKSLFHLDIDSLRERLENGKAERYPSDL